MLGGSVWSRHAHVTVEKPSLFGSALARRFSTSTRGALKKTYVTARKRARCVMFFTVPAYIGSRGRTTYPKVAVFTEIIPLASKNRVAERRSKAAGSSCTQELQALFGCLKKWEFDDKPCAKHHTAYMDCVHEAERSAKAYNEAAKKGTLGDATEKGAAMTSSQFNKIQKLFPQPNLGTQPYRKLKRLPTQDYADDLFHRKSKLGKPS
ncbi:unnamed protein product, partial [Mesorhabditis spiculigera]